MKYLTDEKIFHISGGKDSIMQMLTLPKSIYIYLMQFQLESEFYLKLNKNDFKSIWTIV